MNYIINPSWFYWLKVVDNIKVAVVFTVWFSFIVAAIMAIMWVYNQVCYGDTDPTERYYSANRALIKIGKEGTVIFGIVFVLSLAVWLFLPSKDTLIEMQVARFATYDNAEWTVEAVKGAVDYIVQAIQTVNGG